MFFMFFFICKLMLLTSMLLMRAMGRHLTWDYTVLPT